MRTEGTEDKDGQQHPVDGKFWMDRLRIMANLTKRYTRTGHRVQDRSAGDAKCSDKVGVRRSRSSELGQTVIAGCRAYKRPIALSPVRRTALPVASRYSGASCYGRCPSIAMNLEYLCWQNRAEIRVCWPPAFSDMSDTAAPLYLKLPRLRS